MKDTVRAPRHCEERHCGPQAGGKFRQTTQLQNRVAESNRQTGRSINRRYKSRPSSPVQLNRTADLNAGESQP